MRIGILSLIQNEGNARELRAQNALADALRAKTHDVIAAERGVQRDVEGFREAEKVATADCDGLVILIESNDSPALAQQIALRAGTPVLLVGHFETAYFDSANSLQEGGLPFDRLRWHEPTTDLAGEVEAWVSEHSKGARQQGLAAAQNLYTQRFGAILERSAVIDEAQWLQQFGVEVKNYELRVIHDWMDNVVEERVSGLREWLRLPDDGRWDAELQLYIALKDLCRGDHVHFCSVPELADGIRTPLIRSLMNDVVDSEGEKRSLVCAGEGDANGALTMQILSLIGGNTPVLSAQLGALVDARTNRFELNLTEGGFPRSLSPIFPDVTFARITRRSRRFVCIMLRGSLPEPNRPGVGVVGDLLQRTGGRIGQKFKPVAELFCKPDRLFLALSTSHIHALPGNRIGALRAACDALDIEPIILRD